MQEAGGLHRNNMERCLFLSRPIRGVPNSHHRFLVRRTNAMLCLSHMFAVPIVGVAEERCTLIGTYMGLLVDIDSTRCYSCYLKDYRSCPGGLSAVNAIGVQLRGDLINW